ncbi:MAG: GntR family transcriptional regulator [Mariniblastus sp.]|jgi:GntR family transcriptional regulator
MATQLFFDINTSNGVPVYEQVAMQIVSAIASGGLEAGQMVPSGREMAKELAINPNTVSRAYRQLQDHAILETVRGSGVAVASGAKAKCKSMRAQAVRERISHMIVDARQSHLTDDEILEMIQTEMRKKHR